MVAQREAGSLQVELRSLDLGQAEDVVDQVEQVVAGAAEDQRLGLLVDVGDDAGGVGGDQGVDVGFNQRARVKLLVAQALVRLLLLFLDQLAGGVVGADQQVADDRPRGVAQRRDRDDGAVFDVDGLSQGQTGGSR
jgi:metal-dependent amidase/aminoacylase/carboxypeptidase family protein